MKKNNYFTIIDFGSTNFRLGVFSQDLQCIYSLSKEIYEKNNLNEHVKTINFLIREAEKNISSHLENIVVLHDSAKMSSIDLSIKRDFDQKIILKDIHSSIISEANQLINNNYIDKKIIHLIPTKYIIDGKEYINNFKNNLEGKSIIIELKFISLPIQAFEKITDIIKKCNLQILNFFCSSYVKSEYFLSSFINYEFVSFLDIGWEKSTLLAYNKNKLKFFNSIPIGGNHITKDISKVLKLNIEDSEKIKKSLNKSELEFSNESHINKKKDNLIKEIIDKNISTDLLKKVILARIEEIMELNIQDMKFSEKFDKSSKSILVLIGNGSKLLNKNSFYFDKDFNFKEINFYEESDVEICKSGINFNSKSNYLETQLIRKTHKKLGIFERFFNFFGR